MASVLLISFYTLTYFPVNFVVLLSNGKIFEMRDEGSDVVMDKLVFSFPTSCAADIENVKKFTQANCVMTKS